MLVQYSGRHRGYRRLRRRAISLLFFAWPAFAFAQDKGPADPADTPAATAPAPASTATASTTAAASTAASSAPAAAAQPIVEVSRVGLMHEPHFIASGIDLARNFGGGGGGKEKNGFYPEFSNMMSGAGFVSIGPGYRHTVFGDKAFVDTSAAVSWHFYKMAQARLEFPDLADGHLTVGSQAMYQDNTQVNYFGIGEDVNQDDQTQYRLRGTEIGGYATARADWFSVGAEVGWLNNPKVSSPAGTFNPDHPDAQVVFPDDPAMNLVHQPNFIRSELSVMADTINAHSYPTRGSLYRAAATSYSDQNGSEFSFRQYEAEGLQMVPLGSRLVLGLHAWTVHNDAAGDEQTPFYLIPSIGGNNTLRAFSTFEFHDQNTLVATAELRIPIWVHVDVAPFFDAGNVAPRYSDLNFDKTSVGAGVRFHTARATIGRVDAAHGSEGWRVVVRTSDPFKFSRIRQHVGQLPFAP